MIEAYRRRKAMKTQQQPPYRRPHVIQDSDDEYDSEMEGFIDDEDEGCFSFFFFLFFFNDVHGSELL